MQINRVHLTRPTDNFIVPYFLDETEFEKVFPCVYFQNLHKIAEFLYQSYPLIYFVIDTHL